MTPMPTEVETGRTQSTAKIREVTASNRRDASTLADLHLRLLGHGPMARLGRVFLRDFCYTTLLQSNLMRAAIFEVDGVAAGFVAYTPFSFSFHRTAISGHFFRVAWCTLKSIVLDPRVLLSIPKAIHLMISRRGEEGVVGTDPSAEVVAIGVLPEFRNARFIRETGIRVSHGILEYVKAYFRRAGLSELRMIVEADNRPTLLYYHSLGATFTAYEQHGDPMVYVRFDLREGAEDVPACWEATHAVDEGRRDADGGWTGYWETVELPHDTITIQSRYYATQLRKTFKFTPASRVLDFG